MRRLVVLSLLRHHDNQLVDSHSRRRYTITNTGRAHLCRELAATRRYVSAADQIQLPIPQ